MPNSKKVRKIPTTATGGYIKPYEVPQVNLNPTTYDATYTSDGTKWTIYPQPITGNFNVVTGQITFNPGYAAGGYIPVGTATYTKPAVPSYGKPEFFYENSTWETVPINRFWFLAGMYAAEAKVPRGTALMFCLQKVRPKLAEYAGECEHDCTGEIGLVELEAFCHWLEMNW